MIILTGIRAMLEDLADDAVADDEAEQPSPAGIEAPAIVCVAGRNELDEAAALLLVHLLRSEQYAYEAEALPADALAADSATRPLPRHVGLVCLSLNWCACH